MFSNEKQMYIDISVYGSSWQSYRLDAAVMNSGHVMGLVSLL